MSKPSIKTITVNNLVTFLLVLSLILLAVTGLNLRALSTKAIENQALAHAELVRAGLTAHMKAGIMDKRDYYLNEIKQLNQVTNLHIIRGQALEKQFNPDVPWQRITDPMTKQAFETGEPSFTLDEFTMTPSIRVVIPYIASQKHSLNCLNCHQVDEGEVIGAVDLRLDVTEYRNHSLMVLAIIMLISTVFLILIKINTTRTIQHHVQAPLETLIDNAMSAYRNHEPLKEDLFSTKEFSSVANEINLFNTEIIAHQNQLKEKNSELLSLNDEIESTLRETVYTMGVIEEQRSKETNNHTRRVSLYSKFIAEQLKLTDREIELITTAAPLHDIGKLGIPDNILLKPGKLDTKERELMEQHARVGYTMLCHSKRDILQAGAIIALQHHERWDGCGYPQKLKGEEIHIYGRIIAVADVFDALFSERVYKDAWSIEQIKALFEEEKGKHFDPVLVDIFFANVDEFIKIYKSHPSTEST